jgi:hypothetical protein
MGICFWSCYSHIILCFPKKNYNHKYNIFPKINYYVLLKASYDDQKTCYTIYRVKGYRNPPPSVGKVMGKVTSEMNVKTILKWNCGQD